MKKIFGILFVTFLLAGASCTPVVSPAPQAPAPSKPQLETLKTMPEKVADTTSKQDGTVPAPIKQSEPQPTPVAPKVDAPPVVVTKTMPAGWWLWHGPGFDVQLPPKWRGENGRLANEDGDIYIQYTVVDLNMVDAGVRTQILSGNILPLEQDGIAHRCSDGSGCPIMLSHETVTLGGTTGLHWTARLPDGSTEEWYMLVKGHTAYRFLMTPTGAVFSQIMGTFLVV